MPKGKVLAVDIQPEMLDIIEFLKNENNITNVEPILGSLTNPNLPENSIDLAIFSNYGRCLSRVITAA